MVSLHQIHNGTSMKATHRSIHLKFWLFEHYWWLLTGAVAVSVTVLLVWRESVSTVATLVGAELSIAYFLQKQKLEEMRLFREIFAECNRRYDAMNEELARIARKDVSDITIEDKDHIIDYLNLCGEEYLYFKRGYVEPSVWQAWLNGIKANLAAPGIGKVWADEKETGSYYDLPL